MVAKAKIAGVSTDKGTAGATTGATTEVTASKMPDDKISVNKAEWEVLLRTNRERFNQGLSVLAMPGVLQASCNIRENELVTQFEHTRPNGEGPFTAFPSTFKYTNAGENIAAGQRNPTQVVSEWMNSPGHRANILTPDFGYMGVGFLYSSPAYWVQMFASSADFTSVTTSAGTMNFASEAAMQQEYLICTDKNGVESYVPLDVGVMRKEGNRYTINLNRKPVTLTVGEAQQAVGTFTDVKPSDWFAAAVSWAVEKNITAGTTATTFSPNDTCTRAQILTFLWRAVGSPKQTGDNPFSDVKSDDYFYDAALWAHEKGMVSGKTFEGSTPCTRASTVTYLWKNAGSPKASSSTAFIDVSVNADYAKAVAWAVANSVTSGTSDTTFSPDDTCTRGQIVTFLNRAIQ